MLKVRIRKHSTQHENDWRYLGTAVRLELSTWSAEEEGVVPVVVLQLGVVDGGPGAELRVAAGSE